MLKYVVLTTQKEFIKSGKDDTPDINKAKLFDSIDKAKQFVITNVGSYNNVRFIPVGVSPDGKRTLMEYLEKYN
jgi:hypothetical protein